MTPSMIILSSSRTQNWRHNIARRYPVQNRETEMLLGIFALQGDINSRNMLVLHNISFVFRVIQKFVPRAVYSLHYDDVVSEGIIGLLIAAEKYDPSLGIKFISYAVHWIRQRIRKYLDDAVPIVNLPPNKLSIRKAARKAFYQKSSTQVSVILSDLQQSKGSKSAIDLHYSLLCSSVRTNMTQLRSTGTNQLEKYFARKQRKQIESIIDTLPGKTARIIKDYYEFNGAELTLEEIGRKNHLSRERIRQIVVKGRRLLSRKLRKLYPERIAKSKKNPAKVPANGYRWVDLGETLASPYFEMRLGDWFHECPSCGEIVINSNEDFFNCSNCGFENSSIYVCPKCCADVPLGFKCYCTYTNIDHVVPLRNSIISILKLHGSVTVSEIHDILISQGINTTIPYMQTMLQKDFIFAVFPPDKVALRTRLTQEQTAILKFDAVLDQIDNNYGDKIEAGSSAIKKLQILKKDLLQKNHWQKTSEISALEEKIDKAQKELLLVETEYLRQKEELFSSYNK